MTVSTQNPPHVSTLIFLTGLAVLSLNLILPSLNSIATDLEASYSLVNLSVAGFLAVSAILQLAVFHFQIAKIRSRNGAFFSSFLLYQTNFAKFETGEICSESGVRTFGFELPTLIHKRMTTKKGTFQIPTIFSTSKTDAALSSKLMIHN